MMKIRERSCRGCGGLLDFEPDPRDFHLITVPDFIKDLCGDCQCSIMRYGICWGPDTEHDEEADHLYGSHGGPLPPLLKVTWPDILEWPVNSFFEYIGELFKGPDEVRIMIRYRDVTILDKANYLQKRSDAIIRQMKLEQPVIRCEALYEPTRFEDRGWQCEFFAKTEHQGRWVCFRCEKVFKKRLFIDAKAQMPRTALVVWGDSFEEFMTNALKTAQERFR